MYEFVEQISDRHLIVGLKIIFFRELIENKYTFEQMSAKLRMMHTIISDKSVMDGVDLR